MNDLVATCPGGHGERRRPSRTLIEIRDVSSQLGAGFIRLTVGTPQENEEFVLAYRTIKNETEGQGRTYDYGSG